MRIFSHSIFAASLALGVSLSSGSALAACAISVGKGEGPTKAIAERLAMRDAQNKAGSVRPSNASFSEPACFVADDFKRGIATYGCEVEYSFCTDPKPPVQTVAKKPHGKHHKHAKWHKHRKHHHAGKAHGRITFGGWRKTRTEIACLRFNAKASAPSAAKASRMANGALLKSIAANVGGRFQHSNVAVGDFACSAVGGNRKITCTQSARYCF